jgi:stage III sporulation protein AA
MPKNPLRVSRQDLDEVVLRITNRSVYTREEELKEGYLSMRWGNRAGVCGRFSGGRLRDVTSVNIRIAREVKGCAAGLLSHTDGGLLIAGPPGSGKTTLLRDLIRLISNRGDRVCVIDSRGELCGRCEEGFGLDVGPNTDIITGLNKAQGAQIALRTMFPQYIAFDEVGTGRELELIRESFFSGVKILTTAHASSIQELSRRRVTKMLLDGSISKIALLSGKIGGEITFITPEEVARLA